MISSGKPVHEANITKALAQLFCDDDQFVIYTGSDQISVSKRFFTMFSPIIRALIASLPCCTQAALIIPNFSTSAVKHLGSILESGFTTGIQINSFKEVYEIIDLANLLGIDVSDLRSEIKEKIANKSGKTRGEIQDSIEHSVHVKEKKEDTGNEKSKIDKKQEILLLKEKQQRISKGILSFISLFQSGVKELGCSECSELLTKNNVVEHCKEHLIDVNKRIEHISVDDTKDQVHEPMTIIKTEQVSEYFSSDIDIKDVAIEELTAPLALDCQLCGFKFNKQSVMLKHCTIVHCLDDLEKILPDFVDGNKCKLCNVILPGKLSLQMHIGIKHEKTNDILVERGLRPIVENKETKKKGDMNLYCQICQKKKNTILLLWKHYILEHSFIKKRLAKQLDLDSVNLKCSECRRKIKSKLSLILHAGIAHKKLNQVLVEEGYNILKVPKKYVEGSFDVKKEIFEKDDPKNVEYMCQICDFKTDHNWGLMKHYMSNHFIKEMKAIYNEKSIKLSCTLCDYTAKRRTDLKGHIGSTHGYVNKILSAKGYNPVTKKIRKKKYNPTGQKFGRVKKSIQNDVSTMNVISEEPSSNILEKILETLTQKDMSTLDEQTESNREDLFRKKTLLRISCNKCTKDFSSKITLLAHTKSKHEGIVYKCDFCAHISNYASNLKLHVKRKHLNKN